MDCQGKLSAGRQFIHASLVAATFERGLQKRIHTGAGRIGIDKAGAKGNHVGVIVLAGQYRHLGVIDQRATDIRVTVGGNRNTDTCTAYKDTRIRLPVMDGLCQLAGIIRIIDRVGRVGAKIKPRYVRKCGFQAVFKINTRMIAGYRNCSGHRFYPFGTVLGYLT